MRVQLLDYEREHMRALTVLPEPNTETFVAKIQKAKTRKDKDYFVLRVTIPKDVAQKTNVQPGDFLFFRAKKAEWYHMLDWKKMKTTWQLLPMEIKNRVILEGIPYPGATNQTATLHAQEGEVLGATNPTTPLFQEQQIEICKQM